MATKTETKVNELRINYLSEDDYNTALNNGEINENEIYMTPISNTNAETDTKLTSQWSNKRAIAFGTSLTYQSDLNSTGYTSIVKTKLALSEYLNKGLSGNAMPSTNNGNGIRALIESTDITGYDLITIECGTNDFKLNVPLGTLGNYKDTSFDTTTFIGCLRSSLNYIFTNNPKCTVVLITAPQRDNSNYTMDSANTVGYKLIDYVNATESVADMYSVHVANVNKQGGINNVNLATMTSDGLHMTLEGYTKMAECICNTLATGSSTRIIQTSNSGKDFYIDAKAYGLKGDCSADDAPLFNQLVTELNAQGGGTIYLPNGKYRLNSRITWKSNVSLVGESYNAILMPYCDNSVNQGFAAISWLNTDGTSQGVYDGENPMVNCHFSNFTIDGINQNPANYDSFPKGINLHFVKDCTFENIQFLNTFATGLGIDFLENVFIHNVYCYNCGRGYVVTTDEKIAGGAGIGIGTMGMEKESCVISDCIADCCGNYGIFLEGGAIFPENGCKSNYTIANCQCINGRNYGIAVKGTDNVMIANNIMRNNARDGFAMLKRDSRRCVNVQIVGNLSTLNAGCGYRFADGDFADYISECLYVKDNVSEGNAKDGILISTIVTNMFVEGNIFKSNNRGIAISKNTYNELYFTGNRVIDCVTNLVFDGLFKNANLFNNQLVRMCGVHEKEYDMVYVDDNGNEIEHASSKTTKDFTYCKGSLYCGFYFLSAYEQTGSENRACYCHWYDENMNFISREGATVNGSGWKRFTPPEGACYVKYRIGINTGTLQNSQLKGIYLMRYMTDRCELY